MATLVRTKSESKVGSRNPFLSSTIPAPFPREQLQPTRGTEETISVPSEHDVHAEAGPSHLQTASTDIHTTEIILPPELDPSIASVERTCIMTLNNLLSIPTRWDPIVPDRRHSMPASPSTTSRPQLTSSSSALHILVNNLRNRDDGQVMIEVHEATNDAELLREVQTRVEGLLPSLEAEDTVKLSPPTPGRLRDTFPDYLNGEPEAGNVYSTLTRQLSEFQMERQSSQNETTQTDANPVATVETTLLWSRIDEELEKVVGICKERADSLNQDFLPPQYDRADYEFDDLPEYDSHTRESIDETSKDGKLRPPLQSPTQANEKMRLDFEAVTMAIDRLYMVAPQLHNQRVELKSSKLEEMERARSQTLSKGKQKEREVGELDNIIKLIGKASERSLTNQSVVLEGGMQSRLERARQRDVEKRKAFVEQLAQHSVAGRLHGQDAVLHPTRIKDPDALLTLPEFMREGVPAESIRQDPRALLTLPEFVKEAPPPHLLTPSTPPVVTRIKKSRSRSMSAPALSWLRTVSRSGSSSNLKQMSGTSSKGTNSPKVVPSFEVTYIAENHENLQHILVFFSVSGATAGVDLEAEVLPSLSEDDIVAGDRIIIRSGPLSSLPLALPGRVVPGKKEVRVQSGHFEVKMSTLPTVSPQSSIISSADTLPLLDATQLSSEQPTTFICASCSLPIVQTSKVKEYNDLPSEHWEELVDAWMCHTDQKLNDKVKEKSGGRGFWPQEGQALVGGSYIMLREEAIVKNNICPAADNQHGHEWTLIRCICGAVVGRSQSHSLRTGDSAPELLVFRMLKYALRPVSPAAEPSNVPLSAFIVEDMKEFVQAHASYRFVIHDEEDERPRILIWLFKPSLPLAYATQSHYALPKNGSISAAKVLYELLGPSESSSDLKAILEKYPGFPQAEYLYYPMEICRRLAALLKESNRSYPPSMRVLTGLEVGWLRRA